jgi:hypothetical protein
MERQISIVDSNGSLDSDDDECFETIENLYKQFGYVEIDPDVEYRDGELDNIIAKNRQAQIKSLAIGWILQNAYDRKITYTELLRNVIDARLKIKV